MTHDEMIAVITAHREGKTIQSQLQSGDWIDVDVYLTGFAFNVTTYRVKPEPYRPFKSAEEGMEAIKEHGDWLKVKSSVGYSIKLVEVSDGMVWAGAFASKNPRGLNFSEAFEDYTFADGTPFGKLEE